MKENDAKMLGQISRRRFLVAAGGVVAGTGTGLTAFRFYRAPQPIRIGILHSLSGTMAISETALRDAATLAVEQINNRGGVLGRKVEAIVEDASSNPERFRIRAEKMIREDRVCSIFGCWTSASRKAVLPVLDKYNVLLWYPVQYEGNECSRNVIYTGSSPNQQIIPAVRWLYGKGKRRFYLVGSDYVFPQTANRIVKRQLQILGCSAAGEDYIPLGGRDFESVLKRAREARADVIFSTVNGEVIGFSIRPFARRASARASFPSWP